MRFSQPVTSYFSCLKTIAFLTFLSLSFFNLSAQSDSNLKLKIETGVLWDWLGGKIYLSGPFVSIEPKMRTSKNTFIGLRIGAAHNTQTALTSDTEQFFIDNVNDRGNGVFSFVPTFDYYFTKSNLRPYLGMGVGYYFMTTSKEVLLIKKSFDEPLELNVNNQIGLLLRGGFNLHNFIVGRFDFSKLTLGLVFNYIPKADIEVSNGQKVGTVANSNIALSFGYTFGNRKGIK